MKFIRPLAWVVILSIGLIAVIGSGGGSGNDQGNDESFADCPTDDEKPIILDIMQQWYFWNDEPDQQNKYLNLDLDGFSDGDDLLDFLRYRPDRFDRGFTYITTVEEDDRFFAAGQVEAFGIGIMEEPGLVSLTDVFEGSPAAAQGLTRGDRITAIDGRSITAIQFAEGVTDALGPAQAGVTRTLEIEFGAGGSQSITLTKALFSIDPVPGNRVRTFNVNGRMVGYLQLRSFVTLAEDPLRAAFEELGGQGIQDLVVDLRYNGGGLISTARILASLMAGPGSTGLTFAELRFNSDRAAEGFPFEPPFEFLFQPESLELEKLIFITTGVSASASELVINGLEPYAGLLGFEVLIVGDDTFGKPVGQGAVDYCRDPDSGEYLRRMRVIAFEIVNVLGEGGYYDGLPVDCPASDDLTLPLGDPAEASLAAALELAETGNCPGVVSGNMLAARLSSRALRETGGTAARLAGVW